MTLTILASLIPIAFWYRFGNIRLDRDWTPYCYPAYLKTGYLKDGHVDIKPPLIHWSFKLWVKITSPLESIMGIERWLRLLPALGHVSAVWALYYGTGSGTAGLIYAVLVSTPQSWNHMANTEWLTSVILAWCLGTASYYPALSYALMGLILLSNIKNLPILLCLPFVLSMPIEQAWWIGLFPALTAFILMVGRSFKLSVQNVLLLPLKFGKERKVKTHTNASLLWGPIWYIAPLLAVAQWQNSWSWIILLVIALIIAFKQVVPHHIIWLSIPIAVSAEPGPFTILAFLMVWVTRDFPSWQNPSRIYPLTFFYGKGAHYGQQLEDSKTIEEWIRRNTDEDERIWVNGMENHIYLYARRKAVQINIPELTDLPRDYPRVVVHCTNGNAQASQMLTEKGWEVVEVSKLGLYSILVKK